MSTAEVRTDGSCDEEQDERAEHAAPFAQGAQPAGEPEPGSGGRAESGESGEPRDGQAAEPGTSNGAGGGEADDDSGSGDEGAWDDGLIARRARGRAPGTRRGRSRSAWDEDPGHEGADGALGGAFGSFERAADAGGDDGDAARQPSLRGRLPDQPAVPTWPATGPHPPREPYERERVGEDGALSRRVEALRRLVDLSRTRLPRSVLVEADRVLDAADARERLSRRYTTVAIAGATGSGKSSLFNALAGTRLSQAGMRRPTTATPVACSWEVPGAGPAEGLLDRLGIPPSMRRLMRPESDWRGRIDEGARSELEGLVLIDLPDHDSAAEGHREQVERLLRLVDAVVWVVDPEKYADAVLHERYLRPLAGYAEVTFIVLNQTDRLPGDATSAVLNDLRRLLDEDGMALGEHGEPGARVMATSALVGEGIEELRAELAGFVAERRAASLRLSADLDVVVERLRPEYVTAGPVTAASEPTGLTEDVREAFTGRLAQAAGAQAAGQAAERAWRRRAERACGTPWSQLQHWFEDRRARKAPAAAEAPEDEVAVPGPAVAQSQKARDPYAEAAVDALFGDGTETGADAAAGGSVPEPGPAKAPGTAAASASCAAGPRVARPAVAHAVRAVVEEAAAGLPEAWRRSVRDAAWRGASGLPEALDEVLDEGSEPKEVRGDGGPADGKGPSGSGPGRTEPGDRRAPRRPVWWSLALTGQLLLLVVQAAGVGCVVSTALGRNVVAEWIGAALLIGGVLGGSLLAWGCRFAARGPAAEYGRREEWRVRRLVAGCGQVHVLEPVAAELLRYREVREQFVTAAGDSMSL